MSKLDLASILDDCVQRLRAGEDVAGCQARYPDHAAVLTPMLAAAAELRGLAEVHLPSAARLQAKATLRKTLAARRTPASTTKPGWLSWLTGGWAWQGARGLAVAAACIVLIFGTLTATAVAASQPGDFSYPLRVAVERAPALFQWAPAGRATAELTAADRRLADLQAHLATAGQADATALDALLIGDEAAAKVAPGLEPAERDKVASRVVAHAGALAELARIAPEPEVAGALQAAAERALAIAGRVQAAPPAPGSRPPAAPGPSPTAAAAPATPLPAAPAEAPPARPTATPGPSAEAPETSNATATPTASAVPTATGVPPTATPTADQRPTREHRPTRTASPTWPRPRPTGTARPHPGTPAASAVPPLPTGTPRPEPRVPPIVATLTARPTRPAGGTARPTRVPPIVATLTAQPTRPGGGTIHLTGLPPFAATLTARPTRPAGGTARLTRLPERTPPGPTPNRPRPRPAGPGTATPPAPTATAEQATATSESPVSPEATASGTPTEATPTATPEATPTGTPETGTPAGPGPGVTPISVKRKTSCVRVRKSISSRSRGGSQTSAALSPAAGERRARESTPHVWEPDPLWHGKLFFAGP